MNSAKPWPSSLILPVVGLLLTFAAGTALAQSVVINGTPLVTTRTPVMMRAASCCP